MQCAAELLRDMGHERSSRMEQVEKERCRSFKICPCLPFLEGRAEVVQFFPFVRYSSIGDVSFSTRSHIACVVNRKKSNSRHSHVMSHFLSSAPTSFKNLLNDGLTLAEHIETINLAIRGSFILLFWSEHAEMLLLADTKVLCTYTRNLTLQGRSTGPMKHWEKKQQTRYLHRLNNASCCALTRTWDTHQMGNSAEP